MRQDQFELLQLRAEQLTDAFLDESNPATWPGGNKPLADIDKGERGDRYWCKKNAVATLAMVQRIATLVAVVRENSAGKDPAAPTAVTEGDDELESQIASAERDAQALMDRVTRRRGKP